MLGPSRRVLSWSRDVAVAQRFRWHRRRKLKERRGQLRQRTALAGYVEDRETRRNELKANARNPAHLESRRMKRKWEQERRLQEEEEGSSLAPRNDEENNHMQQQTPFLLQDQGSQSTAGQIVTVRRGRVLAEGVHTTDACFPVLSTWLYSSLLLGQVWDWG